MQSPNRGRKMETDEGTAGCLICVNHHLIIKEPDLLT